jgi:rsbT co-antagonist protein RsbR
MLRFRHWLDGIAIVDPLERRMAGLLQNLLLVLLAAYVIGLLISLSTISSARAALVPLTIYPLLILSSAAALFILRRGNVPQAALILCTSLVFSVGASLLAVGLKDSSNTFLSFTVPIVLGGLLLGRRGLVTITILCAGCIGLVAILEATIPQAVGFAGAPEIPPIGLFLTASLIMAVLAFILDRFGTSLRSALESTRKREQELELLRASLEETVAERTASLQAEITRSEQREARLAQALHELQMNQALVRDLSSPVLPVLQGVLVAPLVGAIDMERAEQFSQHILTQVEQQRANHVIIDITGMPLVDTQVAQTLLQTADAVGLLGAKAILVGVRPEVAQTLVALGARLDNLPTYADLREAVARLAQHN